MSAATSGHQINYKVVDPSQRDLGQLVSPLRVVQKYRLEASKGGPGQTGIIYGSNTNLGSKWYISGKDFKDRTIVTPLNGKDILGTRYMPKFKLNSLFRRDNDQP
jgi:hypothetical protein